MIDAILQRYPALGYPLYRRYWLASLASVGGNQLLILAQGWLIFELTHSATHLGYLGAAAAIPNLLMTLFGGVIADRFDKRRIMMFTSGVTVVLLSTLAWLDWSGMVQAWHVLTVAALFSLITGLDWPTRSSLYPLLIDRSAMLSAVALNTFVWQVTRMAVPAAGGIIMAVADTWLIFALAACGFVVMLIVIATLDVHTKGESHESPMQQLRAGLAFIRHTPLFLWLLVVTFTAMLFSNSYAQLMPMFAALLDAGETGYGYLLAAGGVGSVAGTLVISGYSHHPRLGTIMFAGAAAAAVLVFLFTCVASLGWYAASLLLALLAASLTSVYMVTSMSVLQMRVPDNLRGRVMGFHSMGFALMPLGALILGPLAEAFTPVIAVGTGAVLFLAVLSSVWRSGRVTGAMSADHTT